jgi:hypothetical protein
MVPGPEGIDTYLVQAEPGTSIVGERRVLGQELDADLHLTHRRLRNVIVEG